MIGDKENPSQQSRAPSDAERVEFTEAIFGNKYRKPVTAGDSPKEKMAPDLFIFSRPVAPKSSLRPGMNDQLISVLAPDQEILPFEPGS